MKERKLIRVEGPVSGRYLRDQGEHGREDWWYVRAVYEEVLNVPYLYAFDSQEQAQQAIDSAKVDE
jgi:hypothetical protein